MGIFGTLGKIVKGAGKVVGKGLKVAAPFASLIPGVGLPLAAGLGAGGSLVGDLFQGKSPSLSSAALSGLGAGAGSLALGGKGFKGAGNALKLLGKVGKGVGKGLGEVGNVAKNTFTNERGGLDLAKILGLAGGGAAFLGQRKQSGEAAKFNEGNAKLRQMLMERILEKPNYNFSSGG